MEVVDTGSRMSMDGNLTREETSTGAEEGDTKDKTDATSSTELERLPTTKGMVNTEKLGTKP